MLFGVFCRGIAETNDMKTSSSVSKSLLMRECAMRCSARRVVLIVILIVAVRLLWLSFFSGPSSVHPQAKDVLENRASLSKLIDEKSGVQMSQNVRDVGLEARTGSFYLDGKPLRIIGGSFHYFRTHPKQWKCRLERMKAAYVNTVTIYIPWNMHEQRRGVYDFAVGGWDLVRFIKLVQQMELHLIVRPGPYICAEWDFGGFPSWLLHDPNMVTRSSRYPPYMNHVKKYYSQLLPVLARFTHQKGGPIIAFQIENEFGSSKTSPDRTYLRFLVELFRSHDINELLFTSDGAKQLPNGTLLPEVFATVNFNKEPAERLEKLHMFQPRKPLMVAEFWPGWFDHWGEEHHTMSANEFTTSVGTIFAHNASINLYMFVGGTNFWFWNGANYKEGMTLPTVTSYDYDTLISECGDIHPQKFNAFRSLLKKYGLITATELLPVPRNPPKQAYGLVKVEETMALHSVLKLAAAETLTLQYPVFMEFLSVNGNGGQGYGYIVYRAYFRGDVVTLRGALHDWAQVFVNGVLVKVIDSRKDAPVVVQINTRPSISSQESAKNCLEILVENMGHVNYAYQGLTNMRKGFQGEISSDVERISNWEHIPLEFDSKLIEAIQQSKDWKPVTNYSTATRFYRGSFIISEDPLDTFLDMSEWGKGVAIVNGFVLGRYWNVGPQQTLYVPWPLLKKGKNEVIVFELLKAGSGFKFIDKPILASNLKATSV